MEVSNLGPLTRGANLFRNHFLETETRNVRGRKAEQPEIVLLDLRCGPYGQNRALTRADLDLDLDASFILDMRAHWIGGAALVGQIPVFVLRIEMQCHDRVVPTHPAMLVSGHQSRYLFGM